MENKGKREKEKKRGKLHKKMLNGGKGLKNAFFLTNLYAWGNFFSQR